MPAPGGITKPHLWVAITAPDADHMIVIVSLTTLRFDRDQTTILQPGDHPFVRHETAVLYSDTRIVDAQRVESMLQDGMALRHQPCPAETLLLIQQGALVSPFTPRKIIQFCRRAWGLPSNR